MVKFLTLEECEIKIITKDKNKLHIINDTISYLSKLNEVEVIESEDLVFEAKLIIKTDHFGRTIYFPLHNKGDIHTVDIVVKIDSNYLIVTNFNEIKLENMTRLLNYIPKMLPVGIRESYKFKMFDNIILIKFRPVDFSRTTSFYYEYELYVNNEYSGICKVPLFKLDREFLADEIEKQIKFTEMLLEISSDDNAVVLFEKFIPKSLSKLSNEILDILEFLLSDNSVDYDDLLGISVFDKIKIEYMKGSKVHTQIVELEEKYPPMIIKISETELEWIKSFNQLPNNRLTKRWLKLKLANLKNIQEGLLWD